MKHFTAPFIVAVVLAALPATAELPEDATGTRPGLGSGPTEIEVTAFVIDVSRIDGADQSFTADFFLMLRWHDPRLAGAFDTTQRVSVDEVWNPRMQILTQRDLETTFPEQAEVLPNGAVEMRQRYFGTFSAPLDLHDFPLDRQQFTIQLVVPGFSPDEVLLRPTPGFDPDVGRQRGFSIADWAIGPVTATEDSIQIVAGVGDLSGYVISFDGNRHIGYWAFKAFVSVLIIVAMSWVVFWIDPKWVAPRLSVAVTSMLTLIAYRFLLGSSLPHLAYLTRMDYFLLGATLLVLITIIEVAATTRANDRDHAVRAARINRLSQWAFPLAFVGLMVACFGFV